MNDIKPIKTNEDHKEALELLESLIVLDPADGSEEADRIKVLAALIEDYENSILPDYQVDPIDAIKFRMDQMGLKNVDLVPYLGSKSRVSEILSGKRTLTVKMIKNLEEGLGIPASSLVGSSGVNTAKRWTPKILRSMARRGYFGPDYNEYNVKDIISDGVLKNFLTTTSVLQPALLRQTNYRDNETIDRQLLAAWLSRVKTQADELVTSGNIPPFRIEDMTWIKDLVALSTQGDGPALAIEFLRSKGVIVIVEPPLPNTRLDGAAILTDTHPIIGLTIRHDRLDNFWFTLMHEVAHVALHSSGDDIFFDNLDSSGDLIDRKEGEADAFARESMISDEVWLRSPIRRNASPMIIKRFAEMNNVGEAIVAGRLRFESNQWHRYSDLLKESKVRQLFTNKEW